MLRTLLTYLLVTFAILTCLSTVRAQPPKGQLARGLELFLHEWRQNDPRAGGDGLGPLHNENSCLKCHFLRSPGGAGRLETNIQLISAIPKVDEDPESLERAREKLARIHPSFAVGQGEDRLVRRSIVLHRHDVNPGYAAFRETLLGRSPGNLPILEAGDVESHLRVLVNAEGIAWIVSERNSPALFGSGQIDRLPDSVFIETAARQRTDNIKGRVARTADGRIGRFGWRGQSPSLEAFVATAFAVELGLSNEQTSQEPSPLLPPPLSPPPHDVTRQEVLDVTAFIRELPSPELETRGDVVLEQQVESGRRAFSSIGCAVCHPRHLGPIRDIFSDLLLHDMGEALADPVPGPSGPPTPSPIEPADAPRRQAAPASGTGGYAGPSVEVFSTIDPIQLRLWRTPPLWGVGDSAPYLHDGRAGTLRRAIILHGGEGEQSRNRFFGLSEESQQELLLFLAHLRAPQLIRATAPGAQP